MDINQIQRHLTGLRANVDDLKEMESVSAPNQRFRDNLTTMGAHIEAIDGLLVSSGAVTTAPVHAVEEEE